MNTFQHYAEQLERHPMRLKDTSAQPDRAPTKVSLEREEAILKMLATGPKLVKELMLVTSATDTYTLKILRSLEDRGLVYPNNKLGARRTMWHLK